MARHSHAVGVDFGTSTSLVAERRGMSAASVVPIGQTTTWMPTLAGLARDGLVFGEDADGLTVRQVVRSVKQAITRSSDEVELPGGQRLNADEVIRSLLAEIAKRAASSGYPLGEGADVRLGCPAMWTGEQRARLLRLADEGGIAVDDGTLIDEPIAAGVAWAGHRYLAHSERKNGNLLVFDMGGGTLDIAVLKIYGGIRPEISVLSALGVDRAGDSLDEAIAEDIADELAERGHAVSELDDPALARALVLRAARRAKVTLSTELSTTVRVDPPYQALPTIRYSRERLENAFASQLRDAEGWVEAALRQARLTQEQHPDPSALRKLRLADLASDVRFVLLAGGMSRIPAVESRLGALFPNAEIHRDAGVAPEEAIVAGLSDNSAYDRINLHRPGFDFVLRWTDRTGVEQERVLYRAHTPFYGFGEAFTRSDLSYREGVLARELPRSGQGQLRARSVTGEWLRVSLDGQECDGIAIPFSHADVVLKLQTNGKVVIVDGRGQRAEARVHSWPVIRGRDHMALVLRQAQGSQPLADWSWYLDKEYVPRPITGQIRTANW